MAGKGGGSWKVAYADFVTAMMAFFLVMWICGQDQKVRRTVSQYFSDPLGTITEGTTKKPNRTGSSFESIASGTIPLEERVANGFGRRTHTMNGQPSRATKLVSNWIHQDKETRNYWRQQTQDQLEKARASSEVKDRRSTVDKIAIRQLTTQLRDEMTRDISAKVGGIHREMVLEALDQINWLEIAEDLVEQ